MGRVKDYITNSPAEIWRGLKPVALITRDSRGHFWSIFLALRACLCILRARLNGTLALVHVNTGDRGSSVRKGAIVLFCKMLGVPVFLHFHAVTFERDMKRIPPWLHWLVRLPFRNATCVILLGERWRRWMHDQMGVARDRLEILINGVPVDSPDNRQHVNGDAPLNILFLGSLGERKGVSDLIGALTQVPQTGAGWRACFAGNGDIARYSAAAQRAGLGDKISFPGWVGQTDALALVSAADLMVLPSYDEGLPLIILEAIGLGTPMVTTPVGAIPEVLTDGEDVIFCPPGDQAALAAAITRLLADAPLRQSLCDNGIKSFRQRFSVEVFRANLLAIWERYTHRSLPAA